MVAFRPISMYNCICYDSLLFYFVYNNLFRYIYRRVTQPHNIVFFLNFRDIMEEGSIVRVIRDFLTLNEGELSVVKDEILQIVQVVDRHWVRCQNSRDVGLVPRSNICAIDNIPISIETGMT